MHPYIEQFAGQNKEKEWLASRTLKLPNSPMFPRAGANKDALEAMSSATFLRFLFVFSLGASGGG